MYIMAMKHSSKTIDNSNLFNNARHKDAAEFFKITVRELYKWVEKGCPRNEDDSYDLYAMHSWIIKTTEEKYSGTNLKDQKLEQEIQKLKILNANLDGKLIDRSEMENILTSRAVSLRNFFERALTLNRSARAMRSIEELVSIDYEFTKQMMDAYLGK